MKKIRAILVRGLCGLDMSGGVLMYVIVTALFQENFSYFYFALTLLAAHAPDADFIPYLLIKKWLPYPSHRLIGHHPIFIVPFAALVGWFVCGGYGATLAATAVIFHFLHDSWQPHGMHWLSPFTWWSISIRGGCPHEVPEEQRIAALEYLRVRIKQDGGEILARVPPLRTGEIVFAATAWMIFIAFIITDAPHP